MKTTTTIDLLLRVFEYTERMGHFPLAQKIGMSSRDVEALVGKGLLRQFGDAVALTNGGFEQIMLTGAPDREPSTAPPDSIPPPRDTVDRDDLFEMLGGSIAAQR